MNKRNLLLLAILFSLVTSVSAKKVTVQTAQRVAQSFLNSKMQDNPQIHLIDFAEKAEFPNFYVFGNAHCFVIISADDCVHPVLGYSTENTFETNGMPTNTYSWLKAYDKEIKHIADSRMEANSEIQLEWDYLLSGRGLEPKSRSSVAPLIRTRWDQKLPVNDLCPADSTGPGGHCVAGSGAVAIAQVMNYWEHPFRGNGDFSYTPTHHPEYGTQYANFGETFYDWDNMKNVYAGDYSDDEALAVATLVYHVAVSVQMDFASNNSDSNTSQFKNALTTYFDYSTDMELREKSEYSDEQWIAMLKNDLNAERPIIYRGCDSLCEATNSEQGIAHVFNCDGYDENNLFHFNWGYKGDYDGYYAIDALYPGHEWNQGNRAMFNCHPNTPSINPPVSVNTSVDGQEVTIAWTTVSEAVSYKLYRDDDFISNVTGNDYIDGDVDYGLHYYTVKSVDAEGAMSLKSNASIAVVRFPGPCPSNLQATVEGYDVNLSWQAEIPETAILQYGTGDCIGGGGTDTQGERTSWAQRFPVSTLQEYAGMAIETVEFYVRAGKTGEYTVGIYKGDEMNVTELVYQQSYNATANGWQEIVFPSPVTIDYTQDLWVVFYSYIFKPVSICSWPNHYDALLYSYTQSGIWSWQRLTNNWSWMIRTHLTDGTYTYNLYRDGNTIATNLSDNTYTDSDLPDGFYDYHVTTNYFGGESGPSNTVSVMVGSPTFTINVSANPSIGGSVTGEGTYNYDQSCTVTATPNTGYTFVNWTENGNVVSTDADYTFNVIGDRYLVAHFQLQSYTITATALPSNGGSVNGSGTYDYGQSCTLTSTPATGYTFVNWTESDSIVSTDATYTFDVTGDRDFVAHFQLQSYTITATADPDNGGTVSGDGTYDYGQSCTLTATPATDYTFVNWTVNGNVVSSNPSYTFTVTANRDLVAHFELQTYTITVTADPSNGGSVTGGGTYNYNQSCTVTATPATGYIFINWTENGSIVSTDATYTFNVTGDRDFVAHFQLQSYTITVTADPSIGGTVSGGGTYDYGQTCTIHAAANACYTFDSWTENGNVIFTRPDYSFVVTGNRNLVANFSMKTYEVTAEANPTGGGIVIGAGTYQCGDMVTLTAEPNENYSFLNWTENGSIVSVEPIMQFEANRVRHLTANFSYYDGVNECDMPIEIYPNPVNDILTIKGENILRVTVFNVMGQMVEDREVKGQNQIHIDVEGYESATYILHIYTEEGWIVKRFIKE
jgi:hypothetical protein